MDARGKIILAAGVAILAVMALAMAPIVLDLTASPGALGEVWAVCYEAASRMKDLIPFIYYAIIVVIFVSAIGIGFSGLRGAGHVVASTLGLLAAGAMVFSVAANHTPLGDVQISGVAHAQATTCLLRNGTLAMTGNLDLDGNSLILDTDGDTTITSDTDDQIDIQLGPSGDNLQYTAGAWAFQEATTVSVPAAANLVFGDDVTILTVLGTGNVRLEDSMALELGGGSDSRLYYNGSDTILNVQAVGTGGLTLALGGTPPAPDEDTVHVWDATAGSVSANAGSLLTLETDQNLSYIQFLNPDTATDVGVIVGSPAQSKDAWWLYERDQGRWSFGTQGTQRAIVSAGEIGWQQAFTVSTTAGAVTINPTSQTDVSSDPLVIQNISQAASPGTTVDGQIRLWHDNDAGGVDGRIVFQANSTTYIVNADSGLTFFDRPTMYAEDKARFAQLRQAAKSQIITDALFDYHTFWDLYPDYDDGMTLHPGFNQAFLAELGWSYNAAPSLVCGMDPLATGWQECAAAVEEDLPVLLSVKQYIDAIPHPDPGAYQIADPTVDETISFRTGTQITTDDSFVLTVDRSGDDAIHAVPSLLKDEILHLVNTDADFRAALRAALLQ